MSPEPRASHPRLCCHDNLGAIIPLNRSILRGFISTRLVARASVILVLMSMGSPALSEVKQDAKYAKWQEYSKKLRTDPGLVAYYDFEEGEGTTLHNTAAGPQGDKKYDPKELDGALGGGKSEKSPTWATGRWPGKKGLLFDGVNDYIDCGKHEYFDSDSKTIEVWFKITGFTDESTAAIFDKAYWGGATQYGYGISVSKYGFGLRGIVVNENMKGSRVGASVEPGTWYHLVLVHDYGKDKLYLYLNGELRSKADIPGFIPYLAGSFIIGRYSGGLCWYFKGVIDEVAVYNRALKENEVRQHYELGRP